MQVRRTMKALILWVMLLPTYAMAVDLSELRLSMIEGDVQIKTVDTGEWTLAAINLPLKDGDQIWVPADGRAELESRRGTVVRLDQRSELEILWADSDALQFYLSTGLCYVNAKGVRDTTIQMDTPVASARVYERAKFSVEVADNDGHTDISVYLGTISVENKKGETRVEGGSMLSLGENSADLSPLSLADAWERWNKDQDRSLEEGRVSSPYLPEELAGYSRDFEDNGEWVDLPSYGHVWRPTLGITVDWSPYRHGRWVWIGDDYVWVAREPWGWAPYHYGRWDYVNRFGWCWVPPARHEVYWGPGYVGWVRTPTYVAWVPLAPREIYYGRGHRGPYSVNIVNVNINTIVVKNVYKNVHVRNSVTTVHHDTFLHGRKVDLKVKDNLFLREKISVGGPRLKPERGTKIAVIREIPKSKQPPKRARGVNVRELRERRRLVKREGASAFQPERAPQAMPVKKVAKPKVRPSRKSREAGAETTPIVAPTPVEKVTPPPAGRGLTPKESPASPEGRRKAGQKRPRGEVIKAVPDQAPIKPPTPVEEVAPPPARRGVVPEGSSGPPPEERRKARPKRPRGEEIQTVPDQAPIEPPTPVEEVTPPPARRGVVPEGSSGPPPESRRRSLRTPPPQREEVPPPTDVRSERSFQPRVKRAVTGPREVPQEINQPEAAPIRERVRRPPPAVTKGGDDLPPPPADGKKKGKKKKELEEQEKSQAEGE